MKALSKILVASIFFGLPVAAQAETIDQCLGKISITHTDGKEYKLQPGVHFRSGVASDPNQFGASFALRTGLLDHPAWKAKADEIQNCLKKHGKKKM